MDAPDITVDTTDISHLGTHTVLLTARHDGGDGSLLTLMLTVKVNPSCNESQIQPLHMINYNFSIVAGIGQVENLYFDPNDYTHEYKAEFTLVKPSVTCD